MGAASALPRSDITWCSLTAAYIAGILAANALASKLFVVAGVHVTAGALAIPIVYLTTDLINELYGERATRAVVWMGLLANIVLVWMTLVCTAVPASPLGVPQEKFTTVFAITPRIVFASMAAYLCSSLLDARLFTIIRAFTGPRMFWLRKNGSTIVSQFVDSAMFVLLAFGLAIPWEFLPGMILGQYIVKVAMAPLGTPLTYIVLFFARKGAT